MSLVTTIETALALLQRGNAERAARVLQAGLADYCEDVAADDNCPAEDTDKMFGFFRAWRSDWAELSAPQIQAKLELKGIHLDIKTIRKYRKHPFITDPIA